MIVSTILLYKEGAISNTLPHALPTSVIINSIILGFLITPGLLMLKSSANNRVKSVKISIYEHFYIFTIIMYAVSVIVIMMLRSSSLISLLLSPLQYLLSLIESSTRWTPLLNMLLSSMLAYICNHINKNVNDPKRKAIFVFIGIIITLYYSAIMIDSGSLGFRELQCNYYGVQVQMPKSVKTFYELFDRDIVSNNGFAILLPANGATLSMLKEFNVIDPWSNLNPIAKETLTTLYERIYKGDVSNAIPILRDMNIRYVIILKDVPSISATRAWNWTEIYSILKRDFKIIYEDDSLAIFDIFHQNSGYDIVIDDLSQSITINIGSIGRAGKPAFNNTIVVTTPLQLHDEIYFENKSCNYWIVNPKGKKGVYNPLGFLQIAVNPIREDASIVVKYNPLKYFTIHVAELIIEIIALYTILHYLLRLKENYD
jgi:hypothetical protein